MGSADATTYDSKPLSITAACVGFVASTTALTLIMVLAGNLV